MHIPYKAGDGAGKLQIEIFEKTGEHTLIQPTFAYAYPAEVSPLSRRNDQDPFITDRWEFFIGGARTRQRLLGAERSGGSGAALPGAGRAQGGGRRGGHVLRRRLRARAGIRHAAGRRPRARRRPAGDAVHRLALDPRRPAVPPHAARELERGAAQPDRRVRFGSRRPDRAARAARGAAGEDFIYLGDTARLPYGTKSRETVVRYSAAMRRRAASGAASAAWWWPAIPPRPRRCRRVGPALSRSCR